MANYCFMQICFVNKPSKPELCRLNEIFNEIDYDSVQFTEEGFSGDWRSPVISFQEILNICHKFGYECYGKIVEDSHNLYYKYLDETEIFNKDLTYDEFINHCLIDAKTYHSKPILFKKMFGFVNLKKLSRRFVNGLC